jgi:RNA polymerase sigma factor (sigma-70 family)
LQPLVLITCLTLIMVDDAALVSRIKNDDKQAFKLLITQNQRLVAHMVGRLIKIEEDREELCQDVFLKVYEKIGEFNFKSKLSTWIATIAYRLSINYLQKKRIVIDKDLEGMNSKELLELVEMETPHEVLQSKDIERFLLLAIDQLPIQYKAIVTMFHIEEMSHTEIVEVMEMPIGTVKNYLFRARKLLKESLELSFTKEELL